MLDYRNIGTQLEGHYQRLNLTQEDVSLCFLPLSHVFERAWTAYVLYKGATNCYLQNVAHFCEALAEVRPNVMCAVPRFYEKIFSVIHEKSLKRRWYARFFYLGCQYWAKMAVCRQQQHQPSWMLK